MKTDPKKRAELRRLAKLTLGTTLMTLHECAKKSELVVNGKRSIPLSEEDLGMMCKLMRDL